MKAIVYLDKTRTRWGEALASLVGRDGERPPITDCDCVARMLSVGVGGEEMTQVVVLGRLSDTLMKAHPLEADCHLPFDLLLEWSRRILIYHEANESTAEIEASSRIRSALADAVMKHLEDANPSAAEEVWHEIFEQSPPAEYVNIEDEEGPEDVLEVLYARMLTPAERDRLLSQVPDRDWLPVIDRSISWEKNGLLSIQPWWRSRAVAASVAVGGFVLGTVVLTSLMLPRCSESSKNSSLRQLSSLRSAPSEVSVPAWDVYEWTPEPLPPAPDDVQDEWKVLNDNFPEWRLLNDIISESELASLRTTTDVCQRSFNATREKMLPVTEVDWLKVGWCSGDGGQLICSRWDYPSPFCHYFGNPTKFDLAVVGKAVGRHFFPNGCGIQCNSGKEGVRLLFEKTAKELAPTVLNKDVSDLPSAELENTGRQVYYRLAASPHCSRSRRRCHSANCTLPETGCRCLIARRICSLRDQKFNKYEADDLVDFDTSPERLFNQLGAIALPRHKKKSSECQVICEIPRPASAL
ncbi:putative transmembrane protein [Gregarina niphandrodes]|uniref:Transmembrane protein n=1 Tax=Gregarina niphandrodes TaxID=110365 RepID=A0A023B8S6_GRENI|nr:putative transmembrane protein [Gregarina niphandrodes]EZG70307.1 putative transmembrane protein [Gregarina niphandrodes]|eukprot:XP_011129969.1 putative transmembrane protein [Gregarina niphandrodes]